MDNVSPVVLSEGPRAPSADGPRLASGGRAVLAHQSGSSQLPPNEFALVNGQQTGDLGEYAQGKGAATGAPANEDDQESDFEAGEIAPVEVSSEQRVRDIQQQQAVLSAQYAFLAKGLTRALDARLAQTLALMDEAAQTGRPHEALESIYHSHLEDLEDRFNGVSVVESGHKFGKNLIRSTAQKNRGIVWRDFNKQKNNLQREMGDQLAAEMVTLFKDKRNSQMGDVKVYDWISFNLKAVECLGPVSGLDAQAAKGDLEAIKQKLDNSRPEIKLSDFDNLEDENEDSLHQLAELAQQHQTQQLPQQQQHVPAMMLAPPIPIIQVTEDPNQIPITSHSTARSRSSSHSKGVRHHSHSPAPKRHRHTASYAQSQHVQQQQAQAAAQAAAQAQAQAQSQQQQQQQVQHQPQPQPQPQNQHQPHQPHQQQQLPTPQPQVPQVHTPHGHVQAMPQQNTPLLPVQSPYQVAMPLQPTQLPQPQMLQLPLPGPQQFGQMMSPQPGYAHMNGQGHAMYAAGPQYEQQPQFYLQQGQPMYMPSYEQQQQQFVPQHWAPQKGFPQQMYQPQQPQQQQQQQPVQFFYERPQMGHPQHHQPQPHQQPQQYYGQ